LENHKRGCSDAMSGLGEPQGAPKDQILRKDRSNRTESLKTRRRNEGYVTMRNHQRHSPNGKASKVKRTALRPRGQARKAMRLAPEWRARKKISTTVQ